MSLSLLRSVAAWLAAGLTLLLGLMAVPVHAQDTGAIAGVVVDAKNGETLPGANVAIAGTSTGTSTDLNGRYRIAGLAPGTYDVVYSFIGFAQKTVTGVEVTAGETAKLDVSLEEQTAQMDEVVVEARAARDSDAGLLKERAKAAGLTDAISAETISKSASSDAADAIQKVTGASVSEGKYVNVRGLGGRYVNAQVNGSELPSSDPNRNSVPLDLFPAGLLDNIVTNKTFTPDMPGSFTGGNVNMKTKSFPEDLTIQFSTSVTYHSEAKFDDILRPDGDLGNLPSAVPPLPEGELTAENTALPPFFTTDPQEQELLDDVSNQFARGKVTPVTRSAPVNQSYSASFGNQFEILGERPLGIVAGMTYSQSTSAARTFRTAEADGTQQEDPVTDFDLSGERGSTSETIGGVANLSFKPHPNHELSFNSLYNRTDQESSVFLSGSFPRDDSDILVRRRRTEPIERSILNAQLQGQHLLSFFGVEPRIEWNSSYTITTQDENDVRFFTDDFEAGRDIFAISTSIYEEPTRYFRSLSEFNFSNDLSVSVPIGTGQIKFGGAYGYKERDLDERRFSYDNLGAVIYRGQPDVYFTECVGFIDDNECNSGAYENASPPEFGVAIQDVSSGDNNLAGERTVGAGFGMLDTRLPFISENLRFIGGVRVEYTDQVISTRANESGSITETDFLPSANLVYSIQDNMNVRAAYGRTLARPTFREFSPSQYYDFQRQEIFDGNLDLERTLVDNIDVRWEWFTRPGELFAVSGYFKSFDAPIERVIVASASNREVTFENQQSATVAGLELEARKRLDFIAEALQYVEVGGNFTLTTSTVTDTTGTKLDRPLEGQSDFLLNADVSYANPESGTTVSVFYNYFDDRLDTIEREANPNQFEKGRHTVDFVASQDLVYGVRMKLSVKNILDEETVVYQDYATQRFTTVQYRQGRTISLGLSYDL